MGIAQSNTKVLDTYDGLELVLEILSFADGENTISEDQAMKSSAARVCENWEASSIGGMERAKGFNEVADGGAPYSAAPDLIVQHEDSGGTAVYGVIAGDLVIKSGASLAQEDAAAFTSGTLCHAVSAEGKLFITNEDDNIKVKTVGNAISNMFNQPTANYVARIYHHKNRLIAEGDGRNVYGSRAGAGYWNTSSISAVVFTGAGLNDATSGGTYTGVSTSGTNTYEVEIDATGTPDTFKWKKNSGSYTTGVAITGSAQTLSDGVTITFAATTGHTLGNKWVITVTANGWTASNDAWSITLPEDTAGCVPNFPSGNEILVFTERNAYALSNFPSTAYRPIGTPARGCSAPYSIALGDEGVYFVSQYPTLGVFLFNGVNFVELTELNRDVFVEKIDFSKRIFGVYRNKKYYLIYNETGSGVAYPNKMRVYDSRYSRWMNRVINSNLSDNFGYPALLRFSNNELYAGSSQKDKLYELETTDDSDEGQATQATYRTKDFSSRDFAVASGGQFPIDDVKLKLTKVITTYFGTTGTIGLAWSADRGLHSGSKTIDLTASGDLLNSTFTVNTSNIVGSPPDKTKSYPFSNDAVGKRFYFEITNSGTSTRAEMKKLKIHAVCFDEA